MSDAAITCPACGGVTSGRFCSHCGTSLVAAPCRQCGLEVAAGAHFCSGCGTPVVADQPRRAPEPTARPTHPAVLALLAVLLVGVIAAAVWYLGRPPVRSATQTAANASNDGSLPPATTDIWSLTPGERFTRLTDRIQAAVEAGDSAQVVQFYPMAEGAFDMLLPGDRTNDARFHIALLRTQVGQIATAMVQLDSLMLASPDNLLGHYLQAQIATLNGDSAAWRRAKTAFDRVWSTEIAAERPEYAAHMPLLEQFHQRPGTP